VPFHERAACACNRPTEGEIYVSLNVPQALLDRAEAGPVGDAEFIDCIKDSLPYGWSVVARTVDRPGMAGTDFAEDRVAPPSDEAQGQLLQLMASDPMRAAVERHFDVKLAFQNCCRVAAFRPTAVGGSTYEEFMSARGQLLNQSPELRSC
jgi:hypothetical protein